MRAGSRAGIVALGTRPSALGGASRARLGVTLLELLVAVVIVGLLAGVVGLAVRRLPEPSEAERLAALVVDARRTALRAGRPETIVLRLDGAAHAVTALPNGEVVADAAVRERLGIERLAGVIPGAGESAGAR